MELKNYNKLQILTAKALDLHTKINNRINQQSFNLCSHCSSHGRYCVVADSRPDEKERLIAISDSLKELYNLILSLEKVRSNHKRQRDEALARIEESRKVVRERVRRCSKEERENVCVIAEVIKFVGDGEESNGFLWDLNIEQKKRRVNNGIYTFLVGTARFGLEFLVIFATIYTSLEFAKVNGKHKNQDENDSRIQKQPKFLLNGDADLHLDVLCGRG